MTSIRHRLSLGLTVVLVVLILGQGVWLTSTFDEFIERQVISELQEQTETLLANIHVDRNAQLQLTPSQLSSAFRRPFSGTYYIIGSGHQRLYSRSLWDVTLDITPLAVGQRQIHRLTGPRQQPLLAITATYFKQNMPITITVAQDIEWMQQDKHRFQMIFGLLSLLGAILLIALQIWVVRMALTPLNQVQMQLQQLASGEIERIDEQSADELKPLLAELNRLMNAMVVKTRRSRQALGNLAHRLKTQLSLLNQIAETEVISRNPATRLALYQQTHNIQQIIDRELKRARVAGVSLPGKGVNVLTLVEQLDETLQLIYREKNFHLNYVIGPDVKFNGDREDLLELLGNLLDNACKWCEQRIELHIDSSQKGLRISVEDDGPGCDVADLEKLTTRGFRADESTPGSGLGLAIVYDVVESYNGTMQFSCSEKWKGLQVTIHLQAM